MGKGGAVKVIMKAGISGTRDGVEWPRPGGSIDLPDAEAVGMLNAGLVIPAGEPEPERAVKPRPRGGRRG